MRATDVLVVNAGSTSSKISIVADDARWTCHVAPGEDALAAALERARGELDGRFAVGHRVVHGGERFRAPVLIDDHVLEAIEASSDLAPLHNRASLDGVRVSVAAFPDVPQVACFDTEFHATLPPAAFTYGGPSSWRARGLRRYGFHGLSHQYASARAAELLDRPVEDLRLVSCHLGGGCSLAAVTQGHSVDTTMGLTPLDGLVMATRSGSVDPGLLLHELRSGVSVDQLDETLERDSGLLGLSGVSADMPAVIAARDAGDTRAQLAVDVYLHRLAAGIGSMIAALDRLDAIVFTGGVGEHVPEVRRRAVQPFAWLGAAIDDAVNERTSSDADISASGAAIRALVVTSREDLVIAGGVRALLA